MTTHKSIEELGRKFNNELAMLLTPSNDTIKAVREARKLFEKYGAEMKAEGKEEGVKAERERIAEDIAEKVVQGHFNADPITSIADYAQTLLPSRLTTPREDNNK